MAEEAQQSKDSPDNTLRSTPAVIWVILFILTLVTILALLVPMIIIWITKNPYIFATGICATLPGAMLGKMCEHIVRAHYKLNDRDYIIEEIKANRGIKKMRKHKDEHKNKLSDP